MALGIGTHTPPAKEYHPIGLNWESVLNHGRSWRSTAGVDGPKLKVLSELKPDTRSAAAIWTSACAQVGGQQVPGGGGAAETESVKLTRSP